MRDLAVVPLADEEWEAIRLADHARLDHETAAKAMGVSRPTFSRILARGRSAVAKALAEGAALEIGCGGLQHLPAPQGARKQDETIS